MESIEPVLSPNGYGSWFAVTHITTLRFGASHGNSNPQIQQGFCQQKQSIEAQFKIGPGGYDLIGCTTILLRWSAGLPPGRPPGRWIWIRVRPPAKGPERNPYPRPRKSPGKYSGRPPCALPNKMDVDRQHGAAFLGPATRISFPASNSDSWFELPNGHCQQHSHALV